MSWTTEDAENLRLLLSKAQRSGVLEQYAMGDSGFELVDPPVPGAMTDASKRRSTEDGAASFDGQLPVPVAKAKAEPKKLSPGSGDPFRGTLPPGVASLENWGTTLLEFGKYADKQWSYFELASNPEPRVASYCQWVIDHKSEKSGALFIDLADYLSSYMKTIDAGATGMTYPGSSIPRRVKK